MTDITKNPVFWGTALGAFAVLLVFMPPIYWASNELDYFELALWSLDKSRFTPNHAIFDQSNGRYLANLLMGGTIKLAGLEPAFVILRLLAIVLFALGYALMAGGLGVAVSGAIGALVLFLIIDQAFFAGAWIFKGVEAKVFAYAAVMAGIGLVLKGRWKTGAAVLALATHLHFLVGGFWAAAVLLLLFLRERDGRESAAFFGLYGLLSLPVLAILIYENLLLPAPDMAGLDLTIREIYSVFRASHHVAPFVSLDVFVEEWLPGICWMAGALSLAYWAMRTRDGRAGIAAWLVCLYLGLAASFVLAFLDRNTHFFGQFYLFRPNALVLLLSLLAGFRWVHDGLPDGKRAVMPVVCAALLAGFCGPLAVDAARSIAAEPHLPAIPLYGERERDVVRRVIESTRPEDVVVLEPGRDMGFPWVAFERLTGRPTLVNLKFIPVYRDDLVRWYRLILWRRAVFEGECAKLAEQPAAYLLTRRNRTLAKVAPCGTVVWKAGGYGLVRVGDQS